MLLNLPVKRVRLGFIIAFLMVLLATAAYSRVRDFPFVDFDDPEYVLDNDHVRMGVTGESIRWAFTASTDVTSYWVPLTWLTFLLDYEIYGPNPGGYHVTNLLLHLINAWLLFHVLSTISRYPSRSAFVAFLFLLHPLHVESVAWVTERKDVLSMFFMMLTLWCYARYVRQQHLYRYLSVLFFFILGLMSKPMLITLPFVLLLLDYWPLERIRLSLDGNPSVTIPRFPSTTSASTLSKDPKIRPPFECRDSPNCFASFG